MSELGEKGRSSWSLLIYEEYVAVMGSWNGAAVLARMLKLDEIVREMDRQTESLNARAIMEGRQNDVAKLRNGWFWKTEEEFAKETFLTRSTAKRGLDLGAEKGFWIRRPGERYDGAKRSASWYRVDLLAIDRACKEAGYSGLPGFNPEGKDQLSSHVQNGQGGDDGPAKSLVQNGQGHVQNEQGPCPNWTNTVLDLPVSNDSKARARESTSSEEQKPAWIKEIEAGAAEVGASFDDSLGAGSLFEAEEQSPRAVAVMEPPEEKTAVKESKVEVDDTPSLMNDGQSSVMAEVAKVYHERIGMLGPTQFEKLRFWFEEHGMSADLLDAAIDKAILGMKAKKEEGVPRLSHIEGILRGWYTSGIRKFEDIADREFPALKALAEGFPDKYEIPEELAKSEEPTKPKKTASTPNAPSGRCAHCQGEALPGHAYCGPCDKELKERIAAWS